MMNPLTKINGLMLPLYEVQLVLPQSTVTEVMQRPRFAPVEGSAAWLLGLFEWRSRQIPAISFETLSGYPKAPAERQTRVAVIYALERLPGLAFYAVEIQAIPRPVRLGPEAVTPDEGRTHSSAVIASHVLVGSQKALIPDLAHIEGLIREQLRNMEVEA